jgi:anti-sigma factor RsiW
MRLAAAHRQRTAKGPHPEPAFLIAYLHRDLSEDEFLEVARHVSGCAQCAAAADAYRAEYRELMGADPLTGESAAARVLSFPIRELRGFRPFTETLQQAAAAGGDPGLSSEVFEVEAFRAIVSVAGGQMTVQITEAGEPVARAGIRLLVVRPSGRSHHALGTTNDLGLAVLGALPPVPVQPGGHHMVLDVVFDEDRE